jgi:hypothetical protein
VIKTVKLLLLVCVCCSACFGAGKSYSGLTTVHFTHSQPISSVYYVEYKQNDGTWAVVTSGATPPMSFVIRNIITGKYTFRLRGVVSPVLPATVSNEYTYTVTTLK